MSLAFYMANNDEYSPFRKDPETSRRIREYLGGSQANRDAEFVARVESEGTNFVNFGQGIRAKYELLHSLGIKNLTISRGKVMPVEACDDEQVNAALKNAYNGAKKRLDKKKGR